MEGIAGASFVSDLEKCDRSVLVSPKQSAPRLTAVKSPHSVSAPSRRWCLLSSDLGAYGPRYHAAHSKY